jgi:hypothetical protein
LGAWACNLIIKILASGAAKGYNKTLRGGSSPVRVLVFAGPEIPFTAWIAAAAEVPNRWEGETVGNPCPLL